MSPSPTTPRGRRELSKMTPRDPSVDCGNRPRLFLDCSMTANSTAQAGIQRVVRNVVRCAPNIAHDLGLEARTVVFRDGRWRDVPTALDRVYSQHSSPNRRPNSPNLPRKIADRLYKIFFPRTLVRNARRLASSAFSFGEPTVEFRRGDILLLLDGSWLVSEIPRFEAARRAGAKIGLVAYDLLPVLPERYMLPKSERRFRYWMRQVIPQVDFIVAISRAVRDEFQAWLPEEFPDLDFEKSRVSWFPLGVKLDLAAPNGDVRPEVKAAFSAEYPTYLKVCTFEPRKNHKTVLDAFDQVWSQRPDARLCLIGREGWMCDELVDRIKRDPRLGIQLHWFSDLSDAELSYAYRHAYGTVFASLAEGYGLPIVESLQQGLPTFASDIPVHREVGGDFCAWFPPRQPHELARLLLQHLETGKQTSLRPPAEFRPTTWEESTDALVMECLRRSAPTKDIFVGRGRQAASHPPVPPSLTEEIYR